MKTKKSFWSKKQATIFGSLVATAMVIIAMSAMIVTDVDEYKPLVEQPDAIILVSEPQDDVEEWQVIARINSWDALGEASPGASVSGWLSTFQLNYSITPTTALLSNGTGTNGSYNTWTNVTGFVDTDNTDTDLASERGAYFVVRCRFNDTVKDGADFQGTRCKVILNVTGDETINNVTQKGDVSNTTGGGIVSQNGTNFIWINFYWDDNTDGYRILDDGTLTWSIVIYARY